MENDTETVSGNTTAYLLLYWYTGNN